MAMIFHTSMIHFGCSVYHTMELTRLPFAWPWLSLFGHFFCKPTVLKYLDPRWNLAWNVIIGKIIYMLEALFQVSNDVERTPKGIKNNKVRWKDAEPNSWELLPRHFDSRLGDKKLEVQLSFNHSASSDMPRTEQMLDQSPFFGGTLIKYHEWCSSLFSWRKLDLASYIVQARISM
ncbi:uncharacterized protein BDR25DRAFT_347736 [Lindgomyces ingoldianus]|uniref:Uncharacterized protein n=1 Tax=Lindgomyces ingoldianus TaxID=673940 RepID=A0ACB6RDU5_9PLEO|nr:uncharacterized protein BDR25DRAFT_347736 [Lindgomyces ingoldianus]KAF2477361.1 hypothetical protein BDR25DRAFT_347736 [Lindgomyces ingoldianus]